MASARASLMVARFGWSPAAALTYCELGVVTLAFDEGEFFVSAGGDDSDGWLKVVALCSGASGFVPRGFLERVMADIDEVVPSTRGSSQACGTGEGLPMMHAASDMPMQPPPPQYPRPPAGGMLVGAEHDVEDWQDVKNRIQVLKLSLGVERRLQAHNGKKIAFSDAIDKLCATPRPNENTDGMRERMRDVRFARALMKLRGDMLHDF